MPATCANPVNDDTSWWCPDCGAAGEGFGDAKEAGAAADEHVVQAWAATVPCADELDPWRGAVPVGTPGDPEDTPL